MQQAFEILTIVGVDRPQPTVMANPRRQFGREWSNLVAGDPNYDKRPIIPLNERRRRRPQDQSASAPMVIIRITHFQNIAINNEFFDYVFYNRHQFLSCVAEPGKRLQDCVFEFVLSTRRKYVRCPAQRLGDYLGFEALY